MPCFRGVYRVRATYFTTIVQDKDLPVLKRGHSSSICVQVWVCKQRKTLARQPHSSYQFSCHVRSSS